jgi:serine/threonine protein kinase
MAFCKGNRHPNIIKVEDWGLTEVAGQEVPFYVMPLYSKTLRHLMGDGIDSNTILALFGQILDGIEAAHEQGVWHRDLKPENLLYDPDSRRVVIADFGIAHFAEPLLQTTIETGPQERLANFQYAAPEQRTRSKVDHRADIYALGLILNEMFTGRLLQGTGHKTIGSIAPSHARLDFAVDRMVRQSPAERPQSIAGVRQLLRDLGL